MVLPVIGTLLSSSWLFAPSRYPGIFRPLLLPSLLVSLDTSSLDDVLQERYGQVQPWFAAVVGLLLLFGYSLAY